LWHRNNSWPRLGKDNQPIQEGGLPVLRDSWRPAIPKEDIDALEANIRRYGYKSMEELVRWRLYRRTGGGLMAELGSHQLDACSIFLGKVHPLAVSGVGGKYFYKDDREVEDHVFVTFEFPGKNYFAADGKSIKDKDDIVVVTYSSINTNSFEPYGECVMGSRGTLLVESEQQAMLFPERNPNRGGGPPRSTSVTVTSAGGSTPVLDSSGSQGGPVAQAVGAASLGTPVSKGYREEMEHFAYCIRMHNQGASRDDRPKVRCDGPAAMADAIIALTSNLAMKHRQRIEFREEWFQPDSPEVPDAEMKEEIVTA
jgi:predicted dehydrogenase